MAACVDHFTSGGTPIAVEIFQPEKATTRSPATLLFHGTGGLLPPWGAGIVSFAEALTSAGIVAVIPHFFDKTRTAPGESAIAAIPAHLDDWKTACADALTFARTHAAIDPGRLSLLGFSLGGHLALDLAMSRPTGTGIKCIVDFFAPTRLPRLQGNRALLPPALIHHGLDDETVAITDSLALEQDLRAAGKVEGLSYVFIKYPGQKHGFTGPDLDASRSASVTFIKSIV